MAKADPSNADRQRGLAASYDRIGDVLWGRAISTRR